MSDTRKFTTVPITGVSQINKLKMGFEINIQSDTCWKNKAKNRSLELWLWDYRHFQHLSDFVNVLNMQKYV